MARTRPSSGFAGLRIEGGILPPDFLARVAARAEKHQEDADYGLTRSLSLKDELARYWKIACDRFALYRERRERRDLDPRRVGVEDWLVPLLEDVFGFADLGPARPASLDGHVFPITHRASGARCPCCSPRASSPSTAPIRTSARTAGGARPTGSCRNS